MSYPSHIINNKCIFCSEFLSKINKYGINQLVTYLTCPTCKVTYSLSPFNQILNFYFEVDKYEVWIHLTFLMKTQIFYSNIPSTTKQSVCIINSIVENLTPQNIKEKIKTLINFS